MFFIQIAPAERHTHTPQCSSVVTPIVNDRHNDAALQTSDVHQCTSKREVPLRLITPILMILMMITILITDSSATRIAVVVQTD